jgi:hypothetical protein
MQEKTTAEIRNIKTHLSHLNDCYNVFRLMAYKNSITEENLQEYIKVLLDNYIADDSKYYNKEVTNKSREKLLELEIIKEYIPPTRDELLNEVSEMNS